MERTEVLDMMSGLKVVGDEERPRRDPRHGGQTQA